MILQWAMREIKNSRAFSAFFILNLALGLTGFLCLDAFKSSLDKNLQANSKNFLSADFTIAARRIISEEQIKSVETQIPFIKKGRMWEFFSMAAGGSTSRLVQVKAIDETYPFYGSMQLGSGQIIQGGGTKEIHQKQVAWVYPELLAQLGLKVGDKIRLGSDEFMIADTVVDDSTQTFRLSSLAPKIYVSFLRMQNSSLIQFGSTLSDVYLYKLSDDVDPEDIRKSVESFLNDNSLRIDTPNEAGEDSARALSYLSDYLGLVSLVALFLAALGCAYLYRSYLVGKLREVAIFNSLGLRKERAQGIYLLQLLILGVLAAVLSLVSASLLLPLLAKLLAEFTPIELNLGLSVRTYVLAGLLGSVVSLIVCYPFVMGLRRLNVSAIFQEAGQLSLRFSFYQALAFVPAISVYYFLSVWQARSWLIGSAFVFSFLGAFLIIGAVSVIVLWLVSKVKRAGPWYIKQALLTVSRKKASSLAVVVSLGLGCLLMSLMPQLKASLEEELSSPKNIAIPSLFVFDIQDDQLEPLKSFFKQQSIPFENLSPMVRARIITVNEKAFERSNENTESLSREEEAEIRFRNRAVNLSFRSILSNSENIVEGRGFSGTYDLKSASLPEISLEERYANRLGFKIGDVIKFDIQGVEIEGRVVNLRKVKWNSFQPNFFILFQPGVLEEAPKTWLGSLPPVKQISVTDLQTKLVEQFPNISMVDVARTVKKIFEISDKMSWSLEFMALLSMLAGLVVLFSLVRHQLRTRRWDINMMKILGAKPRSVVTYLLVEYGFLTLMASIFGVLLSLLISFILTVLIFDGAFKISYLNIFGVLVLVNVTAIAVVLLASYEVIQERALKILQEVKIGA